MNKGEKRQEIMNLLSDFIDDGNAKREDIEGALKSFINGIEYTLSDALNDLEIADISQIGRIDDAKLTIDELHDLLY